MNTMSGFSSTSASDPNSSVMLSTAGGSAVLAGTTHDFIAGKVLVGTTDAFTGETITRQLPGTARSPTRSGSGAEFANSTDNDLKIAPLEVADTASGLLLVLRINSGYDR